LWAFVAHRDDQVVTAHHIPNVAGAGAVQVRAVPAGHPIGAGLRPCRGLRAGRGSRDRATSVSNAAASWERAELWLRTNTTRDVGCGGHASSGAVGTSRRWFRRRSPSERSRVSRPAAYTVLR
jgi:hypothetical protein